MSPPYDEMPTFDQWWATLSSSGQPIAEEYVKPVARAAWEAALKTLAEYCTKHLTGERNSDRQGEVPRGPG